jgi:signal transduction histidine kinase
MTAPPALILVVDDTEANRYVLARLLGKAGHEVIEAASLAEAEVLLARMPVLVVCDVNLPDGKGTDFAKRIKAMPATVGIMVLNMSASYTRTQDRVIGLDSGADAYLIQPVDAHEFLATVAALLRLARAEAELRRKNGELELVAHAMSHDLREPLRMVSSYLDLLERPGSTLDDKQRHYLDQARSSAQRMHRMVRDLVSLTMIDAPDLVHEVVDLAGVVQDALSNLEVTVQQCQPAIDLGELPPVRGDRGLISQVFQNLLSNAMKYRSEATIRIAIDGHRAGRQVVVRITDNGLGIPPAALPQLFTVFKRMHADSNIPGSGIGLALCKKIVEKHHGAIGCVPVATGGSTFWFSLPAGDAAPPAVADAHASGVSD